MRRILPGLLALSVFIFCGSVPSTGLAASRVALVIGNSSYKVSPLDNPVRDAALMAATLRSVGFEVLEYTDLNRRALRKAFISLGDRLDELGPDSTALVYYAGHGVQVDGENYLIPIGAEIIEEVDVEIEGVRASSLLQTLQSARTAMNIIILDACRNNPFKSTSRSARSGLARMDAPTGTLLAYSTGPGRVAEDGKGRNSTYTKALARAIKQPGLRIEDVFKTVRINVMDATQDRQVPWESSSLTGNFVFQKAVVSQSAATDTQAAVIAPAVDDSAMEFEFWKSISGSDQSDLYQAYLDQFPNGTFAAIARSRVASLSASDSEQVVASVPQVPVVEPDTREGFDGVWRIRGAPDSFRRYPFGICSRNDSINDTFRVKDGEVDSELTTKKTATALLSGQIRDSGKMELKLRNGSYYGSLRGTIDASKPLKKYEMDYRNANGAYCKYDVTLTRQ